MKCDYTNVKNIYIVCGKTDMRKGTDGLATLIQDSFDLDPYTEGLEHTTKNRHPYSLFLNFRNGTDRGSFVYFEGV